MARYFFHLRDGDRLLPDDEDGEEFPNLDAVRHYVIESARQLLSQAVLSGTASSLHQQIEVVDEAGRTVLTMPVGRATGTEAQT
jgi:hypothetical protein